MSAFKWRQFAGEVIPWAVRWYCRYGISYRELEEMLGERGVEVDHTTLYRWTQRYAPELDKRTAWYRSRLSFSRRVDETYVRVKGRWKYLYLFAVGTLIAERPPHRSVRAGFPHTAPTLGV
jgi:IS6 family transposase